MFDTDIELAIGDSVQMADHILTVLDIHGDEITFRIDHVDDVALAESAGLQETFNPFPPR